MASSPSDLKEEDDYIDGTLNKSRIVIFSKTWCPYCKKVEKLFQEHDMEFFALYLDKMTDDLAARIQRRLKERTSQGTVPNIFMYGKHVGGCSDVQQAFANGSIYDMYNNIFNHYDYDLIVIGGGSGGLAAAKEAVKYGKKVGLVDYVTPSPKGSKWGLGGTCVNVGCIPKKLMHRAALIYDDMQDAKNFGWNAAIEKDEHRWSNLVEAVQNYIKSLNWNYRKQLKDQNVTYFNELATFKDEHTVMLSKVGQESRTVTAKNFIIAVGGRPFYPDFPGANEFCITSDDIFQMKEFPGRTLVIGASYIALECAGFLCKMNIDCTVMVRSILLRGFDRSMAEMIGDQLDKRNVKFIYECVPTSVTLIEDRTPRLYEVKGKFSDGTEFEDFYNTILLATGREPCTRDLGLSSIHLNINQKNRKIIVDEWERTSVKTIFAIGDVVDGKPELTPSAILAGKLLVQRLYNSSEIKMDWNYIPTTVFTPIEYGCVGFSEEEAKEKFKTEIEVFHTAFQPLEKALSGEEYECYAKLVCVPTPEKEFKVVGLHILSPNAGEIVQGFALAVKMGATKKQFDCLNGIHPTCAEVFTSLTITKNSGQPIKASGC